MPKFRKDQLVFWTQVLISGKQRITVGRITSILWDEKFIYYLSPLVTIRGNGNIEKLSGRSKYRRAEADISAVPQDKIQAYEAFINANEKENGPV